MHMPNWRVPASIHCLIISRYRGSNMCSGQDTPGKAMAQIKMGMWCLSSSPILKWKETQFYTFMSTIKNSTKKLTPKTNTWILEDSITFYTFHLPKISSTIIGAKKHFFLLFVMLIYLNLLGKFCNFIFMKFFPCFIFFLEICFNNIFQRFISSLTPLSQILFHKWKRNTKNKYNAKNINNLQFLQPKIL